jgi:hypothetical protein
MLLPMMIPISKDAGIAPATSHNHDGNAIPKRKSVVLVYEY